ncbi:MAG: hypothetical protein AAFQ09_01255 [Pseudomonadota bacterium]
MTTIAKPHGFVTKGIYWMPAGLIGFGYFKGLDNVNQLADPTLFLTEIVFALSIGALFLFRMFWTTKIGGVTRLPADAPRWEHWASKAVHVGLYASVFGIVLSGLGVAAVYVTPWPRGAVDDGLDWLARVHAQRIAYPFDSACRWGTLAQSAAP